MRLRRKIRHSAPPSGVKQGLPHLVDLGDDRRVPGQQELLDLGYEVTVVRIA
jgi:hypothetical protein